LPLYAAVSSIFNVATTAICMLCGRDAAIAPLRRFSDEIAISGQIFDDLSDVEEDFNGARLNFAANVLGGFHAAAAARRVARFPARGREAIARGALLDGRLDDVVAEARRHLRRSRRAIVPLSLVAAVSYVDALLAACDACGESLHRQRVRRLFAGLSTGVPVRCSMPSKK